MDFLSDAVLIDTSAVISLFDNTDQNHARAKKYFDLAKDSYLIVSLNATKQEAYTRARYKSSYKIAITIYNFLSSKELFQVSFNDQDQENTISLLHKYKNEKLSFHDALCAQIMIKLGLYKVFTFDSDFNYFGFESHPLCFGL